jgi:undecaprenyl-diphosphatase
MVMESTPSAAVIRTRIGALQRWDAATLAAASRVEDRRVRRVMRALTRAGDTQGWIVHGLVVATLLRIELHVMFVVVTAALLGTASSQLAKRAFRRPRPSASIPDFVAHASDPDPYSFPSGHTSVAFSIATAAFAASPVLGVVETVLAASIAASRIGLGAHYPVDVLGGIALGLSCGLAAWGLVG